MPQGPSHKLKQDTMERDVISIVSCGLGPLKSQNNAAALPGLPGSFLKVS